MKKTFAQRLQEALEIRGVRQVELVEKTKIGKSAISQYLSGKNEAKQNNLYKIALALNVDEAWLMGFDVPMDRHTRSEAVREQKKEPCKDSRFNRLIAAFKKLDDGDKERILGIVEGLTTQEKYSAQTEGGGSGQAVS